MTHSCIPRSAVPDLNTSESWAPDPSGAPHRLCRPRDSTEAKDASSSFSLETVTTVPPPLFFATCSQSLPLPCFVLERSSSMSSPSSKRPAYPPCSAALLARPLRSLQCSTCTCVRSRRMSFSAITPLYGLERIEPFNLLQSGMSI